MTERRGPPTVTELERILGCMSARERALFLAVRRDRLTFAQIEAATGLANPEVERFLADAIYRFVRELRLGPRPWWRRWW